MNEIKNSKKEISARKPNSSSKNLKMDPSTTFKIKHQKHLFDEDIV
jgi:hypothetical protein